MDEDVREQRRLAGLARADQNAQKAQNSVPVEQRRPWLGGPLSLLAPARADYFLRRLTLRLRRKGG
jgi:hypothetical protein